MPNADRAELHLLGISFRTADEDVRAGLALTGDEAAGLLAQARRCLPGLEAAVLSTCNRTEFFLSGSPDDVQGWHALLREVRPRAPRLDEGCARYHLTGSDAYRHLVRVACGLDSALLGDGQVLGQLRRALTLAEGAGTLGAVLSPALAGALRTGRRARAETSIGRGSPGVGAAVAEALTARQVPKDATVLVLGTGQAATAVTRSLRKAGYGELQVCGRDPHSSARLAARCGGTPAPWAMRDGLAGVAGAVVAATSAAAPVLRAPVGPVVVDTGFPRQVEPTDGATLVSLLSLALEADEAAEARRAAVPAVEAIVEDEVRRWQRARDQYPVERAIKELHAQAAHLTRATAEQVARRTGAAASEVERLLRPQVRRLLHEHTTRLREAVDA